MSGMTASGVSTVDGDSRTKGRRRKLTKVEY